MTVGTTVPAGRAKQGKENGRKVSLRFPCRIALPTVLVGAERVAKYRIILQDVALCVILSG